MSSKLRVLGVVLGLMLVHAPAKGGAIVNGGFEDFSFDGTSLTYSFPGWTIGGANSEEPTYLAAQPVIGDSTIPIASFSIARPSGDPYNPNEDIYYPQEGSVFALLASGAQVQTGTDGNGSPIYQLAPATLSQTFTAGAGDSLTFQIFFDTTDGTNDDTSFATLTNVDTNGTTSLLPIGFASDATSVINGMVQPPWTMVNFTISVAGTYTFAVGVVNVGDNANPSYVGLDDVVLTPAAPTSVATPEPSTLIGLGLAVAMGLGRRAVRRRI